MHAVRVDGAADQGHVGGAVAAGLLAGFQGGGVGVADGGA